MNFQQETKSLQEERLEDCPVCGDRMIGGKYICSLCETRNNSSKNTPPFMASEPEFDPKKGGRTGGCVSCGPERNADCHERVRKGWICACEKMDVLDAITMGLADPVEFKEYLSVNGKTTSRWNNKDGGIFDE
jgi:hypothetical protein